MSVVWNTFQMKLLWVNCGTHCKWSCFEWTVKHISNEGIMSELSNTFQMYLLWLNCETHLKWRCSEWIAKHIYKWSCYDSTQKHMSNEAVLSELSNIFQIRLLWVNCETHCIWRCFEWTVKHIWKEAFMSELWNTIQMKLLWVNWETHFK